MFEMSSAYERALLLMSCLAPQSDQHCLIRVGTDTPPQIISQKGTHQSGPFSALDDKADFDNCLLFGLFHVPAKEDMPDMRAVRGCLQLQDLHVSPLSVINKMVAKVLEPVMNRIIRGLSSNICDTTPEWVQGFSPELPVSVRDSAVLGMNFLQSTVGQYDSALYPWFVLLFMQLYWRRHMLLVQIQISDAAIKNVKVGMERYYPEKEGMQGSYEEAADSNYQLMFQRALDFVLVAYEKLVREQISFDVSFLIRSLGLYGARTAASEPVQGTAVIEQADMVFLLTNMQENFSCISHQLDVAGNKRSDNQDVQYVFDMIKNRAAALGRSED